MYVIYIYMLINNKLLNDEISINVNVLYREELLKTM